jgi:hypothetical protein
LFQPIRAHPLSEAQKESVGFLVCAAETRYRADLRIRELAALKRVADERPQVELRRDSQFLVCGSPSHATTVRQPCRAGERSIYRVPARSIELVDLQQPIALVAIHTAALRDYFVAQWRDSPRHPAVQDRDHADLPVRQ